jgi:hypothetical protein
MLRMRRQVMRELIGKIPTKDPNVTEVVYLAEMVRCLDCEQTVPVGIEVVTVKKKRKIQECCAARVLLPRTWF